jgi:tetratricopeptide (TPR) repeat protein
VTPEERLKRGTALQAAGNLEGAAAEYEGAVAAAPNHVQGLGLLGTVRMALGRPDLAAETFARLAEAAPGLAEGHHFLGLALRTQGRLAEAEAAFRKALACQADHVGAINQLGALLLERGDPEGAASYLERAIALAPRAAEPRFWMALACEARGRSDEALNRLLAVTRQTPDFIPAHIHAARLLGAQGALADAVRHYRRWTELAPESAIAHTELGLALTRLGELEEARGVLTRALALDPDDERAVACMASLMEHRGEVEPAWALLGPRVEAGTAGPDAVAVFAAVAPRLDRTAQALDLIERALADDALDPPRREALHFAAGNLCDRSKDYDRAFAHYEKANALRRTPFDRAAHAAHVDALMEAFSADALARLPRASNRYRLPLFIVGMPRSGTTLVEQILASHPQVFGAGERPEITWYTQRLAAMLGTQVPYPQCVAELDRATLDTLAERYHGALRRLDPVATRVTDKMPNNFLHLGLIGLLLPGARVIHLIRDPRDNCLSCYFQAFTGAHPYAQDLGDLGSYYRQYERLMAHWRAVRPLPMLEVRYEELVADQEGQSRRIVAFAGLEWDERCLRFHESDRPVATASHDQVRRPMYKGAMERWRRYEAHLGPLLEALGADRDGEGPDEG